MFTSRAARRAAILALTAAWGGCAAPSPAPAPRVVVVERYLPPPPEDLLPPPRRPVVRTIDVAWPPVDEFQGGLADEEGVLRVRQPRAGWCGDEPWPARGYCQERPGWRPARWAPRCAGPAPGWRDGGGRRRGGAGSGYRGW